jgi:hypothetical protein
MNNHELQACKTARTFSSTAAVVAVIATVIFSSLLDHQSLHWQIAVATVALAIGIPHGALDHLVARSTGSGSTMFGFVVRYVLTAVVALIAILMFNMIGFVLVLVMSAVHFGIGDTSFIAEIDKRTATKPMPIAWLYAISAGFVPVIIPLTKSSSESALQEINVNIVGWHGGFGKTPVMDGLVKGGVELDQHKWHLRSYGRCRPSQIQSPHGCSPNTPYDQDQYWSQWHNPHPQY